ncbi:MAG: hypothetical protein RQ862_04935 [Candidatus Caldarchaeales archaeon]|nr:hypothetical protein [Candidatus Caldarchaeales archaeon]
MVGRVFVDFGRGRLYALPEDGQEVVVFNDFLEMFGKLRPRVVVADSYPRKLLTYSSRSMLRRWSLRLGLWRSFGWRWLG